MRIPGKTFHCVVGDYGVEAKSLTLNFDRSCNLTEDDITLIHAGTDISGLIPTVITNVTVQDSTAEITFDRLVLHEDTEIIVRIENESVSIFRDNEDTNLDIEHLDEFEAETDGNLVYRIYRPEASFPIPLILFLHGGGECGTDNLLQMIGTMGAIELWKRYPEMVIFAPQAPDNGITTAEMLKHPEFFKSFDNLDLSPVPDYGKKSRGWNRSYLGLVADKIRTLIADGTVDPHRIYITGMSMGGGGSLEMLSVAPDLFAGALILCPSMNCGTWPIAANLPNVPTWFATAYIDHQQNRHALLQRAVMKLWQEGRRDVQFTLFTSDELKKYGIGCHEGLTTRQLYGENHNCWTLAYHNEMGMLDWLTSQTK